MAETGGQRVIHAPYTPEVYQEAVKGMEQEPEGGLRCQACFALRLGRAAREARERGCPYFTTTLTLSPHKDAALLNALGEEAAAQAGVTFLASDFKKRGGYPRSIGLRLHSLYRTITALCLFKDRTGKRREFIPEMKRALMRPSRFL